MRYGIGATVVFAALAAVGCGGAGEPLEEARRAIEYGDSARAIGLYQEYLEEQPDDYLVLKEYTLTLGERWAYQGGDRRPIIENLGKLYEQRPSDRQVQRLLAVMLVAEGQAATESLRYEEAEAVYRRAIAVNPESGQSQYHLGLLYEDWQRPDEAFAQYRAAAAKRPQIPDLYLRLGRAYLQRDDPDRAITTLGLVLELAGVSTYLIPEAHCSLAQAYARKEMSTDAQEHLERAAEGCDVTGLDG